MSGTLRSYKTISVPAVDTITSGIADAHFNWIHPDITEDNFKHEGNSGGEIILVEIKETPLSSEEVIEAMKEMSLVPGTLEDLLGVAIVEPNLQMRYPIICLSATKSFPATFNGKETEEEFVCGLWRREGVRTLSLFWYKEDWPTTDFFFIARKQH